MGEGVHNPSFRRGTDGGAGSSVQRSSPLNPRKTYLLCLRWAPSWAAGGALTFVHISSHFALRHSFVSGVARGRYHTPDGSLHLVYVCHSFGLAYLAQNFHFISVMMQHEAIFIAVQILRQLNPTKNAPNTSTHRQCQRVCVCVCVCARTCACTSTCAYLHTSKYTWTYIRVYIYLFSTGVSIGKQIRETDR